MSSHAILDKLCTKTYRSLRRHIRDGVDRKILGSITEHGCQWSFIDWVENYRSPDPYIDEDELRMCPLIWCRKTFHSKESVISHVFECPRLSNAWYWCPYHKRPERYLECNKLCDTVPKIRIRNKEYKLHLADKFLNWICRKRFEKKTGMCSAPNWSKKAKINRLISSKPTPMNKRL